MDSGDLLSARRERRARWSATARIGVWTSSSVSSGARASGPLLPSPGKIDPGEDDEGAEDLLVAPVLSPEDHAGCDAGEEDEVLVDEYAVGPYLGDAPLPGGEPEGGGEEHRVHGGAPDGEVEVFGTQGRGIQRGQDRKS